MHAQPLTTAPEAYVPAADWKAIDATIVRLAKSKGEHDYEQGRWLLAARRAAVHGRLGFASFREYVERRLGYDPRATADRLRVAEALADLPLLAEALRSGELAYSAIREIVRIAVPETEAAWRAACAGETIRDVERRVAGLRPGSAPDDPKDPALRTHVVRLALSPELFAHYREAIERLRREVDPGLSDEEALGVMLDGVLSGTGHEERAPCQVSYTVCRGCERTWQQSKGELLEVEAEAGERAECDAQVIGDVSSPDGASAMTHVGATPGALTPHEGARRPSPLEARAYQTVAPRVRREVFSRDQGRCAVPGCRNHRYVDVHHLTPRALGGGHEPSGLILLCRLCRARHKRHYAASRIMPREGVR